LDHAVLEDGMVAHDDKAVLLKRKVLVGELLG
jgi:hypothetical protein